MAKILVVGDVHMCSYSSIVRKRGEFYSQRLENILWSVNWIEKIAHDYFIDKIIYLGDFFDRANLEAEELTAFRDIVWSTDIPHIFLTGNHEAGSRNLQYSSIHFIESLGENFRVVDEPYYECGHSYRFFYLPYIFESNRQPVDTYIKSLINNNHYFETQEFKETYIFSHNDLKGIQYGCIESKEGFELEDIEKNCRLFINGHIHNGSWVKEGRILNLGNLTGQNFNEDAYSYRHNIMILDTNDTRCEFIENPYAFNFIRLEINNQENLNSIDILPHSVISVKCKEDLVPQLREILNNNQNVEEYRIISVAEETTQEESTNIEFTSIDHLKQFQEYIINQLGSSENVIKELNEVVK